MLVRRRKKKKNTVIYDKKDLNVEKDGINLDMTQNLEMLD